MPPARLLTGPARSDRAARIDAWLAERWGRAMLLVPTANEARERQARITAANGLPGAWGQPVAPFAGLVTAILEGERLPSKAMGDLERRLLLRRAIDQVHAAGQLETLGQAAATEGFLTHTARLIEGLKQAAVEPADFRERAAQRRLHAPRDLELAAVYEAYQALLHEADRYDRIGLYWRAALVCAEKRPACLPEGFTLALDGFDDFTPSELRLVEGVAPYCEELVFGMQDDGQPDSADLYSLQRATVQALMQRFHAQPEPCEAFSPLTYSEAAAAHLLTRGAAPGPSGCVPNIRVVPCADAEHQAEWLARQVKTLLLDEDVRGEEVAIVCRDAVQRGPGLEAVFSEAGVPLTNDAALPLTRSACVRLLLGLTESFASWPAKDLPEWLGSPWLGPAVPEAQRLAAAELARRLERRGALPAALPVERDALVVQAAKTGNDLPAEALDWLVGRLEPVLALQEDLAAANDLAGFAAALDDAVGMLDLASRAAGDPMEAAALLELRRALGILHRCAGDAAADLPGFVRMLRRTAESAPGPMPRRVPGSVVCLTPDRIRNRRFAHVFLLDANEGQYPRPAPANALYTERDLADWSGAGVPLETHAARNGRETALFQHVLAAAQVQLTIAWTLRGADGREARRSPLVAEIEALFPGAELEAVLPEHGGVVEEPEKAASPRDVAKALSFRGEVPPELTSFTAPLEPAIAVEARRYSAAEFGPFDGALEDPAAQSAVLAAFGERHSYSVSQLETYLHCPFQFFVARLLGIEEPEESVEEIDAAERGLLLHRTLERFHRAYAGKPVAQIEDAADAMRKTLDAVMTEETEGAPARRKAVLEAERYALARLLDRYLFFAEPDESWRPAYFEAAFGKVGGASTEELSTPEPFILETASGPIRLSGIIDRIDLSGDGPRVIDYKTGQAPGVTAIMQGRSLQLPLYALALEHHLLEGEVCFEVRFIPLGRTPGKYAVSRAGKRYPLAEAIETAKTQTAEVLAGIQAGRFTPTPQDNACTYCPVRRACRYEKARVERKIDAEDGP